jgi:hypothetical protein
MLSTAQWMRIRASAFICIALKSYSDKMSYLTFHLGRIWTLIFYFRAIIDIKIRSSFPKQRWLQSTKCILVPSSALSLIGEASLYEVLCPRSLCFVRRPALAHPSAFNALGRQKRMWVPFVRSLVRSVTASKHTLTRQSKQKVHSCGK